MIKKLPFPNIAPACNDIAFITFFFILLVKSLLFVFSSYKVFVPLFQFLSFLPVLGVLLVFLSFSLFITNRFIKLTYLLLLDLFFSVLFLTHALYYRYFDDFASLYNLGQIYMLSSVLEIIIKMIGKEFVFIADLLFMPFLLPFLIKKIRQRVPFRSTRNISLIFLVGFILNIPSLTYYSLHMENLDSFFERKQFLRLMGIMTYQVFDTYNYLSTNTKREAVTKSDLEKVQNWFTEHHEKTSDNHLEGIGHNFNLIVIQVESLQNFVIGMKWNGNEITPNLNQLTKRGIYFHQIFDQTWAGNTSDSTFLANCSFYPSRRGSVAFLYAQNSYDCLPEMLSNYGYTTATMHAYRSSFWNRAIFEKALGFKHQLYEEHYSMTEQIGWGLSDRAFFTQSIEKINSLPSPYYAYLTTLTTHVPFDYITAKLDNFPLGVLEGETIGHYIRSMHYLDYAVGEFMQKLSNNNLMSNTIIVIYGDHRARFEENDLKAVGFHNMDELNKIPLIIYIPNINIGYEINTIGGLIDFTPTISNLLGIDVSNRFFMGRDLINDKNSFVIFRDGSFISQENIQKITEEQLMVSDLILEKDLIKILNNN